MNGSEEGAAYCAAGAVKAANHASQLLLAAAGILVLPVIGLRDNLHTHKFNMAQPNTQLPPLSWRPAKKILFRAVFLLLVLYMLFFPNEIFPISNPFYEFYSHPLQLFIPWMGNHILHLPGRIVPSYGNGDTTYDYLVLLVIAIATLLGCLTWSLIDRRHTNYRVLYYWLIAFIRFYCAFTMFSFGIVKLFKLQFTFPSPGSLVQPFGTYSPMHAAWAFFGYSKVYNYFMGGVEILAGMLLLFRRTTRLGALLLLAVIANITVINYCYDVVEKIISTFILFMTLFLLLQERKRLIAFFFYNKIVEPESEWKPRFTKKWITPSLLLFKYVLIVGIVGNIIWAGISLSNHGDDRIKPALHGIFNVETFVRNRDTLPPLLSDTVRWRRLIINDLVSSASASVRGMNDSAKSYVFKPDTIARKIEMYSPGDTTQKSHLSYAFVGRDSLRLWGKWKGDSVLVILRKYDLNNFILVNRGFHFINDRPYYK